MVLKDEQERIRTLLRDTITLLCRNGLSFKSEFSIEALIGITLDKDDVVLVSINELIKTDRITSSEAQDASSDEAWDLHSAAKPYYNKYPQSGDIQKKRKRPVIKTEGSVSDDEDGVHVTSHRSPRKNRSPSKRVFSGDHNAREDLVSDEPQDGVDESQEAVIVKKEYVDENWPPAGVVQEVTVGDNGSDSGNSDPATSVNYPFSSMQSGYSPLVSGYRNAMSGLVSPGSAGTHPMTGLPMMNGLPFPPIPMPQSHFAQALGRLVGSVPPSLSQQVSHVSPKHDIEKTPTKGNTPIYHPTSRSSLPKEVRMNKRHPILHLPPAKHNTLPKEAVALMTDWLRKNMHNPYPTDDIKDDFVHKTGLTFNQINYWFTNARRRLLPKWEMQRNMREQELVQQQLRDTDVGQPTHIYHNTASPHDVETTATHSPKRDSEHLTHSYEQLRQRLSQNNSGSPKRRDLASLQEVKEEHSRSDPGSPSRDQDVHLKYQDVDSPHSVSPHPQS